MSLIIDAIRKAQQLRLKELRGAPFLKGPGPDHEKRRRGKRPVWVFVVAGLGALLLLFLLGNLALLFFRVPQGREIASEKKDVSAREAGRSDLQESLKEDIPPSSSSLEKSSQKEPGDELFIKSKPKKKKRTLPPSKAEIEKIETPSSIKDERPSKVAEAEPEPKTEKRQAPSPAAADPIKKALLTMPKQETPSKPESAELEIGKNRTLASEILTHFNAGVDFYHQRDFSKAIQAYQKVIELDPGYAEAYNNLGILYQDAGDLDKALASYQKAIELNQRYGKALNNLGILLYLKDRFEESIEAFQKALSVDPGNIESLINLGILFKKRGQTDKAIECYRRALDINPLHGAAHYNMGILYEQLENVELAIDHYQQFIQLSSKTHPGLVAKVQKHINYLLRVKREKK